MYWRENICSIILAHNVAHPAHIGKIFVKIVPAHRDTQPATPPPTHTLHRDAAHPAHGRSSQMQLADAAHLLDNSRGLTAAARERMLDYEQSVN